MPSIQSEFYSQIEAVNNTLPDIDAWDPPLSGDMDCVIKSNGRWQIDGVDVSNKRLVRLFSTVLKRENDDYFLLTPQEKWRIKVDDLPFIVIELNTINAGTNVQIIRARTNVGDLITIDALHPLTTSPLPDAADSQLIPIVTIRSNLQARFNRNTYMEIAALLESLDKENQYSLMSANNKFTLNF